MKRFMIWTSVAIFVIGLGVITFWNVPQWRLYTADWKPLAMTHAENYCSATIGVNRGFLEKDPMVAKCMENTKLDNTTPSIAMSETWACQGVRDAGVDLSISECINIFQGYQLWILEGGGLAGVASWSDTHPRPTSLQEGVLPEDTRSNRGGDTATPSYEDIGDPEE